MECCAQIEKVGFSEVPERLCLGVQNSAMPNIYLSDKLINQDI